MPRRLLLVIAAKLVLAVARMLDAALVLAVAPVLAVARMLGAVLVLAVALVRAVALVMAVALVKLSGGGGTRSQMRMPVGVGWLQPSCVSGFASRKATSSAAHRKNC